MAAPAVRIVEVGPRDGLQNESRPVPTDEKIRFIEALAAAGLREIEAGSFVAPGVVPQLDDADVLFPALRLPAGTVASALVPNLRGLERAAGAGVRRVAVFTAASETFNRRNIRAGISESIGKFRPVAEQARALGISVRGYVSTAFHCPFEGPIPTAAALDVADRLLDLGCDEISIGDTVGRATPRDVAALLDAAAGRLPADRIALHFHDTWGLAIANVVAGLARGIRVFDASAGGLGGCPFAPGASGNVATEDLVFALEAMGFATGVDPVALDLASTLIERALGRELPSRVRRARLAARRGPLPPPEASGMNAGSRPEGI